MADTRVDPQLLKAGRSYVCRRDGCAVMPSVSFGTYSALMGPIRRMQDGDEFKVLEVKGRDSGRRWYRVRVMTGRQKEHEGWLNSVSLYPDKVLPGSRVR